MRCFEAVSKKVSVSGEIGNERMTERFVGLF